MSKPHAAALFIARLLLTLLLGLGIFALIKLSSDLSGNTSTFIAVALAPIMGELFYQLFRSSR